MKIMNMALNCTFFQCYSVYISVKIKYNHENTERFDFDQISIVSKMLGAKFGKRISYQ